MISKDVIKEVFWYFKHPIHLDDLWYRILNKAKFSKRNNNENGSEEWCERQAISTDDAIMQLTGTVSHYDVATIYSDHYDEGLKRVERCPVRMGGAGNIKLLYALCEYLCAKHVIETGVAYGWSSMALLFSLAKRDGSQLISIDRPYPGMENSQYVGLVIPDEYRDKWRLHRRSDRTVLPMAIQDLGKIDLCHYDSDKSYEGRIWAYRMLWKALRSGGIFISDDIADNTAFKDFSFEISIKPIVVRHENKYVGLLLKP